MPRVEGLLAADGESVLAMLAMAVMLGIEENGHCCSLSYPSCVGSVGDIFALVFLFPSSVLLDELRDSKIAII